jgi:CHAT domain-containing protein
VPFSALPLPRPGGGGRRPSAPTPLIARYEVVSAPSGSIVHLLRRERAGRPAPFKAVAVFADPVFDVDDSRVPRQAQPGVTKAAGAPTPRLDLRRAAVDIGLTADDVHFGRLPYTRTEATAIRRMVSPAPVLTALDFAASRATAISGSLRDFRIVHFATHAIVDAVHPELSGIVLSLVDEQGGDQDGFLRLQDIYNLDLAAELVVLSACRTGLGREVRGEGFLGLTRAFMYAGASRVVVSLWKIEDQATAHLMELFYRYMFRNRLEPEAALRAAQLEMSRQPRWRSPYFWAGFVLSGDWRPLPRQ